MTTKTDRSMQDILEGGMRSAKTSAISFCGMFVIAVIGSAWFIKTGFIAAGVQMAIGSALASYGVGIGLCHWYGDKRELAEYLRETNDH